MRFLEVVSAHELAVSSRELVVSLACNIHLDNKSEVRYHHDDELMDLLEPDYRR